MLIDRNEFGIKTPNSYLGNKIYNVLSYYYIYNSSDLIFSNKSWLIRDKMSLIIDSRVEKSYFLKDLSLNFIVFNSSYDIFDFSKKIHINDGFLLNTNIDNYYHFTFDVFLKLIFISQKYNYSKNIIMIEPKLEFQLEIISYFKNDLNFYFANDKISYKVSQGYILEYSNNLKEVETVSLNNLITLRNYIFLKHKFKQTSKNRIYIKRNSRYGRNIINIEFENYLISKGFIAIELEKLSLFEQYSIFYNAEFIISSHGASLTNMVVTKSKTTLIEIQHINRVNNYFYYIAMNLDIYYFLFLDESPSTLEDPNIIVDLDKFKSKFDNLLKILITISTINLIYFINF
jgi:capsular polysaccharide biosynthesis protein